jgi:hypothetical protein
MTLVYACKIGIFVGLLVADVMTYATAARRGVLLDSIEQPLFSSNSSRVKCNGAVVFRVKGMPRKLLYKEHKGMHNFARTSSEYDSVHSVYMLCESANVNAQPHTQNAIYANVCTEMPLLKGCTCKNS